MLYEEWREFAGMQQDSPRNLDAAFLGFCKK
jgi:hypothetical protein